MNMYPISESTRLNDSEKARFHKLKLLWYGGVGLMGTGTVIGLVGVASKNMDVITTGLGIDVLGLGAQIAGTDIAKAMDHTAERRQENPTTTP